MQFDWTSWRYSEVAGEARHLFGNGWLTVWRARLGSGFKSTFDQQSSAG
jgi:hypothetical protein